MSYVNHVLSLIAPAPYSTDKAIVRDEGNDRAWGAARCVATSLVRSSLRLSTAVPRIALSPVRTGHVELPFGSGGVVPQEYACLTPRRLRAGKVPDGLSLGSALPLFAQKITNRKNYTPHSPDNQ